MKQLNFTTGRHAENMARRYLENLGYQHIQSNFKTRFGEIDLIMSTPVIARSPHSGRRSNPNEIATPTARYNVDTLVFIEVKYKSQNSPGTPEDMITPSKIHQIMTTAQAFLLQNPRLATAYPSLRLDAVCITGNTIKHYVNLTL